MQNNEQNSTKSLFSNAEIKGFIEVCFEKLQISSLMDESFKTKALQFDVCVNNHKILLDIARKNSLNFEN